MQPMGEIGQALEGVDLQALHLDRDELLLRPTWWPSPSPGVRRAEEVLRRQYETATILEGVWISNKGEGAIDSKALIGGGAEHDNGWAAMVLQSVIQAGLPDLARANGGGAGVGRGGVAGRRAARLNNLGCARLWLGEWAATKQAFTKASNIFPTPLSAPDPSPSGARRWPLWPTKSGRPPAG